MPPDRPDLNALDYCVWSMLKERLNKHSLITDFTKLTKELKKKRDAILQKAFQAAIVSWQRRVRAVESAK